jgi:hypothetical protein
LPRRSPRKNKEKTPKAIESLWRKNRIDPHKKSKGRVRKKRALERREKGRDCGRALRKKRAEPSKRKIRLAYSSLA